VYLGYFFGAPNGHAPNYYNVLMSDVSVRSYYDRTSYFKGRYNHYQQEQMMNDFMAFVK
jgi:hypothetical protein